MNTLYRSLGNVSYRDKPLTSPPSRSCTDICSASFTNKDVTTTSSDEQSFLQPTDDHDVEQHQLLSEENIIRLATLNQEVYSFIANTLS